MRLARATKQGESESSLIKTETKEWRESNENIGQKFALHSLEGVECNNFAAGAAIALLSDGRNTYHTLLSTSYVPPYLRA